MLERRRRRLDSSEGLDEEDEDELEDDELEDDELERRRRRRGGSGAACGEERARLRDSLRPRSSLGPSLRDGLVRAGAGRSEPAETASGGGGSPPCAPLSPVEGVVAVGSRGGAPPLSSANVSSADGAGGGGPPGSIVRGELGNGAKGSRTCAPCSPAGWPKDGAEPAGGDSGGRGGSASPGSRS